MKSHLMFLNRNFALGLTFFTLFTFCFLVIGCFSRSAYMTRTAYDDIQIGSSVSDVSMVAGEPYAIRSKGGDVDEYEYIERIEVNNEIIAENHYFLTVFKGKVTAKRMKTEKERAFDLIYQEDPNYPSNVNTSP